MRNNEFEVRPGGPMELAGERFGRVEHVALPGLLHARDMMRDAAEHNTTAVVTDLFPHYPVDGVTPSITPVATEEINGYKEAA